MNLRPLGDRIVVERVKADEQTQGGLYLPDKAQEKPQEGRVAAVGDGALLESGERKSLTVKPGDRIVFGKYSGAEIRVAERDYIVMRESDVLAILETTKDE